MGFSDDELDRWIDELCDEVASQSPSPLGFEDLIGVPNTPDEHDVPPVSKEE